jgi:hypothetical protein
LIGFNGIDISLVNNSPKQELGCMRAGFGGGG